MAEQLDPSLVITAYHLKNTFESGPDTQKAFQETVSRIKYFRKMHLLHPKVFNKVAKDLMLLRFKRGQTLYFKDENPEGVFVLLTGRCAELQMKSHTEFYNDL